jgi:hypothetical protein
LPSLSVMRSPPSIWKLDYAGHGLSRIQGNGYVRFLGEEMAAQPDGEAQVQPDEETQNLASLRRTAPKMGLEYPRLFERR